MTSKKIWLPLLCVLLLTACSGGSVETIDKSLVVGNWETESEVEKVSLSLNEDNTFTFKGTGFATEDAEDVTLTETGEYTIEGNQLILNIQDVESSGLEYEDFQSENLGDLTFYMEVNDDDTELNLTETSGSVAYNFKKVN